MELKFSVEIELPEKGGRAAMQRAARLIMLKLAAELIQCSVAADEPETPPTTEGC